MRPLILLLAVLLASCATNDFTVVEALRVGMSAGEAQTTIQSYGFKLEQREERPASGWPQPAQASEPLVGRASAMEERLGQEVLWAEYYPVQHGLLGFGELYLFYGKGDRLLHFYRRQIN